MQFDRPLLDYKGYKLCSPCWNGHHWHNEIITGKDGCPKKSARLVQDCLGEPCECPCRALRGERQKKVRVDLTPANQQLDIDMTNPIQVGNIKTHKDE